MELKIFNSILFKELRPWLPENQIESSFIEKLRQIKKQSPENSNQLYQNLRVLLSDHPRLIDFDFEYFPPSSNLLIKSLYDVTPLDFFNATSEYYLNLIRFESIRVLNNFISAIDGTSEIKEKKFLAKNALKNIKYIVLNSTNEFNGRKLDSVISSLNFGVVSSFNLSNTNIGYALYMLKQYSISLYFEIQILFKDYLKSIESREDFYLYTLQEKISSWSVIPFSAYYYELQFTQLINEKDFKQDEAIQLLDNMKSSISKDKPDTINIMCALENFILIKLFNLKMVEFDFATLANFAKSAISANSKAIFIHAKNEIQKQINQKFRGDQRLDVVQDALDELSAIDLTPNPKITSPLLSAPRKLYEWLINKKDLYKLNISNVFSPEPDLDDELRFKSTPLSVKGKPSMIEMKTTANNILKFMSGNNIQDEKIMEVDQYNRMVSYTLHLIETGKLPSEIKKIPPIKISVQFIRYTFYKIHFSLYGNYRIKDEWIDFLHAVFSQFDNTEKNTTKIKFSKIPGLYETDIKKMSR